MSLARPTLFTFDIFGTVLDWRTGLETACRAAGRPLGPGDFDRVIDAQAQLEQGEFTNYATVTQRSLVDVLEIADDDAADISANLGHWPLYSDASVLQALMHVAPCAAMTNSDRRHGKAIQDRLGFRLSTWLCAEDIRLYKPDPEFWRHMSRLQGIAPGPGWWHVSAYADYDLAVARDLGLTTVFINRPHARAGPASATVTGLSALLTLAS